MNGKHFIKGYKKVWRKTQKLIPCKAQRCSYEVYIHTLDTMDRIDVIDASIQAIADPLQTKLQEVFALSKPLTFTACMIAFTRRARKCVLDGDAAEQIVAMREILRDKIFNIIRKGQDNQELYFLGMMRRDLWSTREQAFEQLRSYTAAVQALTALPTTIAGVILETAFPGCTR